MKTTFLSFIFAFLTLGFFTNAQQGVVSYDVYFSTDDPQMSAYIDQMENSEMKFYFNEDFIRTDFYMGGFSTNIGITSRKTDSTLVLIDAMMGKIAMQIDHKDTIFSNNEDQYQLVADNTKLDFTEETKEILGYTCYKAVITSAEGHVTTIWYTKDIVPSFREGQYLSEKIDGFPLEIHSKMGPMDVKMVAYSYKKKVKKPEEVFNMKVPDGYVLKSMEELSKMGGGM